MTNKVDLNNIPENFVITYYANKHKKIITRNGSWTKPTDFMTTGKAFISKNGVVCFIYWDNDAEPDERQPMANGKKSNDNKSNTNNRGINDILFN